MINIYTVIFNNYEFLSVQKKTFDRFLKDRFCFYALDNTDSNSQKLQKKCLDLDINYLSYKKSLFPLEIGNNPSLNHSKCLNYLLKKIIKKNGYNMILDSDIFLLKDFSINDIGKNYDVYGLKQSRKNIVYKRDYFWPGLFIFNASKLSTKKKFLFNFKPSRYPIKTDTGGGTYKILENRKIKKFFFDSGSINNLNFDKKILDAKFEFQTIFKNTFIHFGGGSNWYKNQDIHKRKTFFYKILEYALNN